MSDRLMILLPKMYSQGRDAALLGTNMSTRESPMGFTFCPYADGSAERWNFMAGCVETYMREDCAIKGEQ